MEIEETLRHTSEENKKTDFENNVPQTSNTKVEANQCHATDIMKNVKRLHAGLLFEPEGWHALKDICLGVSAIPPNSITKGWRDLAAELNLSFYEIGCVANYTHEDYTELVIKTYAQNKDATISNILQCLINIERYDVIRKSETSLQELYESILIKAFEKNNKNKVLLNNGVQSYTEFKNVQTKIHEYVQEGPIIHSNNYFYLYETLPITLKKKIKTPQQSCYNDVKPSNNIEEETTKSVIEIGNETIEPNKELDSLIKIIERTIGNNDNIVFNEVYQKSIDIGRNEEKIKEKKQSRSKYEKIIMLTYASDAIDIVQDIAKNFRTPREGKLPIGVLTLSEQKNIVLNNPEKFILDMFPQVDYIVPILTQGYFKSLRNYNTRNVSLLNENIDQYYTSFIHDLICKHYVKNNCLNEKVRCIIPDYCVLKVTNDSHFINDPTLQVWLLRSEVDTLIEIMLKH